MTAGQRDREQDGGKRGRADGTEPEQPAAGLARWSQPLGRWLRLPRAEHGTGLRECGALGCARDPEVGDLERALIAQEQVLRLDVAVDEAGGVRVRQAAGRL